MVEEESKFGGSNEGLSLRLIKEFDGIFEE